MAYVPGREEEVLIRSKSREYTFNLGKRADNILQVLTTLFSKMENYSNITPYWTQDAGGCIYENIHRRSELLQGFHKGFEFVL